MTTAPLTAAAASAAVALLGVETAGATEYVGDVVGVGGLAAVCVFLFRWAQTELSKARNEGAEAVTTLKEEHRSAIVDLKKEHDFDLELMTIDRNSWRDRFLHTIKPPPMKD